MLYDQHSDMFSREFDFWKGTWKGSWLFIQEDNTTTLISVTKHKVFSVLNGKALIETAEEIGKVEKPHIQCGLSLRYLNAKTEKWVMIQAWPNKERCIMGTLHGEFERRRCEMQNEYTIEDTDYLQKYTFSDISDDYFRWDRQISTDGGEYWKTTMKLHFDRLNDSGDIFHENNLYSYYEGRFGSGNLTNNMITIGNWTGVDEDQRQVQMQAYNAIAGYGQILHLVYDETEELWFLNYDTTTSCWNLVIVDNQVNLDHVSLYSQDDNLNFSINEEFNLKSFGDDWITSVEIHHEDQKVKIVSRLRDEDRERIIEFSKK